MGVRKIVLIVGFMCACCCGYAQNDLSSDELFQLARKAAFNKKNYPKAKDLLYTALQRSPDYADIRIFLGRIYTWTDNYDSARVSFEYVKKIKPDYVDLTRAYTDLEYWNENYEKALAISEEGLAFNPASTELLIRRTKVLVAMKRYAEAEESLAEIFKISKNNPQARSLADKIKDLTVANKISASYDYVYFDRRFDDPWHLVSIDYGRNTGIGSVIGRLNYSNRFKTNGYQVEVDAYPGISKTFYSYINVGYSDNVGVFPHWRGGFSLYANLPKSFEGEIGFRYLKFSGDPTWIYTGSIGKYYSNWLFTGRTFITPSSFTNKVSASYSIAANYYYKGNADDMISGTVGYGISPDDRLNSILLDNTSSLLSYKAGLSFRKKISQRTILNLSGTWYNQEYRPQTTGNQFQVSAGWLVRF